MPDGSPHPDVTGRSRRDFAWHVLPALVWAALVFVGGSIPSPTPPVDVGFPIDKVNHFIAFFVMQLLGFRALGHLLPGRRRADLAWLAWTLATALGVALEVYQLGVPHRSAELADAAANAVGAFCGVLVVRRRS